MPEKLNRETVFFEDFNIDRDTNWTIERNEVNFIETKDGVLYYQNIKLNIQATPFPVELDTSRNFEMEFRAKAPENKKDRGAFFWGREGDGSDRGNYWYFHKNGRSRILNLSDSTATVKNMRIYRLRNEIKGDNFNVYTIRKWNHVYYFYVNNHLVKTISKEILFYGNLFGLGCGSFKRHALTIFDYFRISYIS